MYQFFLIKLYLKSIKHMFDLTTFEEISKEITKKKVIKTMNRVLNIVYEKKVSKKFTKIFLTTLISFKFTDVLTDSIDIKDDPISYSIHTKSIKIVNTLKNILESSNNRFMMGINFHILKKEGDKLIHDYRIWDIADKEKIIQELILIYIENYEFGQKYPELEDIIKHEQTEIVKKGHSLIGNIDENYFKHYLDNYINNKRQLGNMVSDNMHKAYWDSIRDELVKCNFIVIIPLLKEVRDLFKQCVPNRTDLHRHIDENIDCDFIEHMIKNDAIDNDYINNLSRFIYSYLTDFQPRSEDKAMGIWYEGIIKLIDDGLYDKFFIEFFKKIIDKLNKIITIKSSIIN